ncbi:phage head-tail connector protein [Paraburkholderia panacisoli]|uniref:Phage head-tail connector protein n=1 Tax=Paraburkholderia panacisoli TaxID=2603818 RepID=A0A5B0HLF6_9BURK|nr:phage head-tail connector protein [Paraburkholderia panacisoli]KAA1015970.1 phage head-tail connector protein [Paraburkholderia panacisoli]
MPERLILPHVGEPVSLDEAKLALRVTDDSQDLKIQGFITSARIAAETKTRQQLLHARWQLVLDRFPMAGIGTPLPFCENVNIPGYAAIFPHAPLVNVVSVTYLDMNGTQQTMDPDDYVVNDALTPAIITPGFGKIWPIPLPQIAAVQFTYNAGYASPFSVPVVPGNQIKVTGPAAWNTGDTVEFYNSGGALPTPLEPNTPYTIGAATASQYVLVDSSGATVQMTDAGAGLNFIGVVPQVIRDWILLRVGSLYENREEVLVMTRGHVEQLPFIDSMLDPYRISLP